MRADRLEQAARLAALMAMISSACGQGQILEPVAKSGGGVGGDAVGGEPSGGSTGTGGDGPATGGRGGSTGSGGSGNKGGSGNAGGSGDTGGSDTGGSGDPGGSGGSLGGSGGPPPVPAGTAGVWEPITPQGVSLSPDFHGKDQNYGAMGVLADPRSPGTFYSFFDYQGAYKSTDWGLSWAKVSRDNKLEQGRPWALNMPSDGSYILSVTGYGPNEGVWISTDGAATWTSHAVGGSQDCYGYDIDPKDKKHLLATMHSTGNIYESKDGGLTWADRGPSGTGASPYAFFVNSTTWLVIAEWGNSMIGTRRTTNSGASWTKVGPMEHFHGQEQIFIDTQYGNAIYIPSVSGVFRSTDGGATFKQVSDTYSAAVFATATRLYSTNSSDPKFQTATRANGADWTSLPNPASMTQGARLAAVVFNQAMNKWMILSGNWRNGLWRYIEK
jgi:hypothetical protein